MSHTLLENAGEMLRFSHATSVLWISRCLQASCVCLQLSGSHWYLCPDDGKASVLGLSWDNSSTAAVSQWVSERKWEYPSVLLSNAPHRLFFVTAMEKHSSFSFSSMFQGVPVSFSFPHQLLLSPAASFSTLTASQELPDPWETGQWSTSAAV